MVDGFTNPSGALPHAPVGGRRRRGHSAKKLRLVKKSTVRNMLKKKGMKMRGGSEEGVPSDTPTAGGRRHSRRRSHRRRGPFGLF